jgi:glycosyltransferase involved in cell wall biosynthesis
VTARVHHFVPTWEPGAVGAHVVQAVGALREAGIDGNVYAGVVRDGLPLAARPLRAHAADAQPGDVLCYQHAIGSTVADYVADRREPLVVEYHNVTPHEFFDAWDRPLADALDWGRRQLRRLAQAATLGLADSRYNEAEMRAVGFATTVVVPVLVDVRRGTGAGAIDAGVSARLRATKRGTDVLFVGRLAPNKAQHEIVKAFALYRRTFDPEARLWLVGAGASARYRQALDRFVARAGLHDVVTLTGPVSDAELASYYDVADVFCCLSRHEGVGVPVLEAMAHDVPVVARASSAVTETVAGAGVLLDEDAPTIDVAAALWTVVSTPGRRDALVAAGRARVAEFALPRLRAQFVDALAPVLARARRVA